MNRTSKLISEIEITDRQRLDLGDIPSLAESIARCGLIQPVVINQSGRLVAGRRRLAACSHLGWSHVDVVFKETLSEADLQDMELEEDIRRKDRTWQERCIAVAKVHYLKAAHASANDESWGQRQTGEMLGVSLANVNYMLKVASRLSKSTTDPIWQCDGFTSAIRLLFEDQENKLVSRINELEKSKANTPVQIAEATKIIEEVKKIESSPDALTEERERYSSNPLNVVPFETYWEEKQSLAVELNNTIYLSNSFVHGDAIDFMSLVENRGRFDHVVTDIPYAIDMENLEQDNSGMNISSVEDEHGIAENVALIEKFFPAAFLCTKENAFVVTWIDVTHFSWMMRLAIDAGFVVQRWPITWVKTSTCMNQCAHYNFTKNTEVAIVCRKPKTVLVKPSTDCVVVASNEEMKRMIGHPFAKPRECWKKILDHIAMPNSLILEPFAGRGSGTWSIMKEGHRVISVEINADHFNHLVENIKQHYYLKINPDYVFK